MSYDMSPSTALKYALKNGCNEELEQFGCVDVCVAYLFALLVQGANIEYCQSAVSENISL